MRHSGGDLDRIVYLGGGQLARMGALAAARLGVRAAVAAPSREDAPAFDVVAEGWTGAWDSPELVRAAVAFGGVLTLENEFIPEASLRLYEAAGGRLVPSPSAVGHAQDKLLQKDLLAKAGLPVPRYEAVACAADVVAAGARLGWPLVLKSRRLGYDGYGNARVESPADAAEAFTRLSARSELLAEEWVAFRRELAVIVARGADGSSAVYPAAETFQQDHVCHHVAVPAACAPETSRAAREIARGVAGLLGQGLFGVEMFEIEDGRLLVNEVAPRTHNSGHYTLDACEASQFENHVRAVLGWPLGSPRLVAPAAAMVNLLAEADGPGAPRGIEAALAVPGARLHLYGKRAARRGRKMGHVTALGASPAEALETARRAAAHIRFQAPSENSARPR